MSSAGGTLIKYVKGSVALGNVFGTQIPTPAFERLRITNDALKGNYKVVESGELVDGFDVGGYRRVGLDAGGQLGTEFVFGNLDDLLEGLFFSTWQRTPQRFNSVADQEITDIAAGTGVITHLAAAAGNENRVGTFAVGHLVRGSGETLNAGNNFSTRRVTAAGATSVTVPVTGLVNNAAPNAGYRIKAVGIEAPAAGNISISTAALGAGEVAIITGAGVDFVALGVVAGMWLKGAVFPITANNGWFRVLNVTTTRLGLDRAPSGVTTDTAAAVQVRLYMPDYLRNGAAALSWFDIERSLPQLTVPEWHYFLSMVPSTWTIRITPQGIMTCTLDFVGSKRLTGTARVAGATDPTADALGAIPRVGDMFDTSSNVAQVMQGNTRLVDVVTDLTYSIANGVAGLPVVANLGFGRVVRARFRPTVSLASYYDSRDLLANLENDTAVGISTVLTDPIGTRAFVIDYPSAKIQSGDVDGIQPDSELTNPLNFGAFKDPTLLISAQLMRFEEYA